MNNKDRIRQSIAPRWRRNFSDEESLAVLSFLIRDPRFSFLREVDNGKVHLKP